MNVLAIIGIIWFLYDVIKEAFEPHIPAENWRNKKLAMEDQKRLSKSEFLRNLRNGKYR